MRVAVSTVMLNESARIQRWAESAADADLRFLADTGSTDNSVAVARALGVEVVEVRVQPWRFDTARNAALALMPRDIDVVITLDVDEVLVSGWRGQLEQAVREHPEARRWTYTYVWSWLDGQEGVGPDVMFVANRTHARDGWRWHGAVHEVLVPALEDSPLSAGPFAWAGFRIEHYADASKSRSSYLPLLEQTVREEPHNPRQAFYYARELYFTNHWDRARVAFTAFLAMPEATWTAERAEAYRYIAKMDAHPETWFLRAIAEAPERRDACVDLADWYLMHGRREEAAGMAARALRVKNRPGDYMSTARVWDDARLRAIVDEPRAWTGMDPA